MGDVNGFYRTALDYGNRKNPVFSGSFVLRWTKLDGYLVELRGLEPLTS